MEKKIYVCGPEDTYHTRTEWSNEMFNVSHIKRGIVQFSDDCENIPDDMLHMYIILHTETSQEVKNIWREYYERIVASGKSAVMVEK